MKILSLFDCSGKITQEFIRTGHYCISLDISPGHNDYKVDIVCDILDFNYKLFDPGYIDLLFIALPCDVYSIASAGHHFKKNKPLTAKSIKAINILIKIWQIVKYFKCHYIFENPAGGLINNTIFNSFFKYECSRISQAHFGFRTQKKTDLLHSFPMLLMSNPVHRVNGHYSAQKLYNMTYRQKVTYPDHFVKELISSINSSFQSTPKTQATNIC